MNEINKFMLADGMASYQNQSYRGIGVREDELLIRAALKNNISQIPRNSRGSATLYHAKMGFLPVTDDEPEIKNEIDFNSYINGLMESSPDIKPYNFEPIIYKEGDKFYLDINTTQAIANVNEIKERLSKGETYVDINCLNIRGVSMMLSGAELKYWQNLITDFDRKSAG